MSVLSSDILKANIEVSTPEIRDSASNTGSANQVLLKDGSNNLVWDNISPSVLPTGVPEIYNSVGLVAGAKVFVGAGNTAAGTISFNTTSAGFTNILSAVCSITSADATANQGVWSNITNLTTNNCTVTTYFTATVGLVVLGINVLGSLHTAIYTGVKNIKVVIIGN